MVTLMAAGMMLAIAGNGIAGNGIAGAGIAGAGIAGEGLVHEVAVEHRGQPLTARYRAEPVLTFKEIGARTPNRPSVNRCRWTARLDVRREVVGTDGAVAAFDKRFEGGEQVEGWRPGSCIGAREAIVADARARLNAAERLAAAAAADRATLTTELASVGPR